MPTSSLADCRALIRQVAACGGTVPEALSRLLQGYDILAAPRPAQAALDGIIDHILAGTLNEKTLDKLIAPAALVSIQNQLRGDLTRSAEHTIVGAFRRELDAGGADAILDGLRGNFTEHAEAIQTAKRWINVESSTEHLIASGEPEMITMWNSLQDHINTVQRIGMLAARFGSKSSAPFGQIREYAGGDAFRVSDLALMCADGDLIGDSQPFLIPDGPHRASAWFKVPVLRLHSIESATERYRIWAEDQWEAQHPDKVIQFTRPEDGRVGEKTLVNPFAKEEVDA